MWVDPYVAPTARVEDVSEGESKFFLWRCWGGGARLWQAFWLVLVLGHAATNFLRFPLLTLAGEEGAFWAGMATVVALNLLFAVFALVSVWRCAPNTDYRVCEAGARGLVILLTAILLWQFVQGAQTVFDLLPTYGGENHLQCNAPDS